MGSKGGARHLKRKPAPRVWMVKRKKYTWITKPSPGPHPIDQCLPLTLVLRDFLGFAKTAKEAKTIVAQGKVYVDGKICRDEAYPAGIMDIITIPEAERSYRVLPSPKGLILHPVGKEEAAFKLCRIENKTTVPNGHVQLNLHDGTCALIRVADPKNPIEDTYRTLDTLKINLPTREILGYLKLGKGAHVILVGGKNVGRHGKIVELEETAGQKRRAQLVTVEDNSGNRFQTTVNQVLVVGDTEPSISLPEVK
ncbi:MAG: 30S ribosomal protein S4e [Candidatus Bathyarchaeia archaeon]|nr:30S ribosomal protein S4e [Candidatus Bathyarchaeota archaeon A05DMB-4]MDH7595616.1 30S ribosomal protein S4e [Candidatus Bathyarchaeota archaeon]